MLALYWKETHPIEEYNAQIDAPQRTGTGDLRPVDE